MIQRGLAILLSVCMLTGGISDTSYAMSPQENVMTLAEQDASETGEISELLSEEVTENPETEDGEKSQENQAESGNVSDENNSEGSETGNESGSVGNGAEGGNDSTGSDTGNEGDTAGSEAGDGSEEKETGTEDGNDKTETGNESDIVGNETGDESDITGSETGDESNTIGNETRDESDIVESETKDENGIEADVTEEDATESVTEETEEENGISTLGYYYKEEELKLTIGTPQTVTLENEEEQQWLSFTAPETGLFRFYSESEGDDRWKGAGICHRKFGNTFDWADCVGIGNFSYSYYMQAKETIYLLVSGDFSENSGTFTVNVEKVETQEPEELKVTKNAEGNYTLLSENYRLNLVLMPSYTRMKVEMELLQADGNALSDENSCQVYFEYSAINSGGSKDDLCDYFNGSKYGYEYEYLRPGREFEITNLIIRDKDNSQNLLAMLSKNGQKIAINTIMTEQKGSITKVTAEDTRIGVEIAFSSANQYQLQLLRYRKKIEEEWSYCDIERWDSTIVFDAYPNTEYMIELVSKDLETVYDKAEIKTEMFAATDIETKITNITSSSAEIQVSVGKYTGNQFFIHAKAYYTDSAGDLQVTANFINSKNIEEDSILLDLHNLSAGTEYKDLEIQMVDGNFSYSTGEYVGYKTKVSFTTVDSNVTEEQIDVTVTPNTEDSSKAVLNVNLKEVTEGDYSYTLQSRMEGRKDWDKYNIQSGSLNSSNSYTDEQDLTSLIGNTVYELRVTVDGISKTVSFTTASAAIYADVEVEPLTAGVCVTAALTGADETNDSYQIHVDYYDEFFGMWCSAYLVSHDNNEDQYLTADKNWKTTAVFHRYRCRFDEENDWRVSISNGAENVYDRYFTLKAAKQEIFLTAKNIKTTQAQIRVDYKIKDDTSIYGKGGYVYYRVKGTGYWFYGEEDYSYEESNDTFGGLFNLSGLKQDTEYEVKFVGYNYSDDILAQTSFRTPKETRNLSASLDDYSYTSAQVSWSFDNGEWNSPSYICLHYREKGSWKWRYLEDGWKDTNASGKCTLENLEPGKTYEVLAELKESDKYYYESGYQKYDVNEGAVINKKIEFTTKAVDYILTAEKTEEEQTAVSLQLQLSNPAGNLEKDAKATVILQSIIEDSITGESVSGNSISEETVDLNQKNQYNATAKVGSLLPNTKYTVKAKLFESEDNVWVLLKNFMFGEVTTKEAKAPTSLALEEKEIALGKGMKKKLTVKVEPQEAAVGLIWTSSDEAVATVDRDGTVTALKVGEADITVSSTSTGSEGLSDVCHVTVKDYEYDFSITKPETDNVSYQAIKTTDDVYQVAAGVIYRVNCVVSSADTDLNISVDQFNWSTDHDAVTCVPSGNGSAEIKIPENVSGAVKITAAMKDEVYKDKSYTITLDVLKKPDIEVVPDTYMWLDYSNRLLDAGLPENWQWEEKNTRIYEAGQEKFTAYFEKNGYYPYKTSVTVHIETVGDILSVDDGNYNEYRKAYIVKKAEPLRVSVKAQSVPNILYEQTSLLPDTKDASYVKVSDPDQGYYSVTSNVEGTYTVSVTTSLKKASFKDENGSYVMVAGDNVKDVKCSLKFIVVDNTMITGITFKIAEDSPEQVSISDNAIEYKITADNADDKNYERKIILKVSVTDADGKVVQNPNLSYTVSDTSVVKQKKEGSDRLVLTIPKGADGLAKVVATAKDEFGFKQGLAVRVKDYTPRVTDYKATVNKNYNEYVTIAQAILPYVGNGDDKIETIKLVETKDRNGTDVVAGLEVHEESLYGGQKYDIGLKVIDKNKNWKKGTLKYYLAVTTKVYGAPVFFPLQIKMETSIPNVTVKQTNKVNVFYKDTTHLKEYDAVSMGLLELSSSSQIEFAEWRPNGGAENVPAENTFFEIKDDGDSYKNGKNTKKYRICQNNPILSNKKPAESAIKGKLYIHLSGYDEAIEKQLMIQTIYKKPVLKMEGDYKVCPALGYNNISLPVYTNAVKQDNSLIYVDKEYISVWKGYSKISCVDQELKVEPNGELIMVSYSGTGDKKTQFTFNSDYWYEPLTAAVKVKVVSSKVKLSPATVTLNTAYSSETAQTAAMVQICNAAAGYGVDVSNIEIEGSNAKSKQLLRQNLDLNYGSGGIVISLNNAKTAGSGSVAPGSYKFKLTPSYGTTKLNTVTLNVKVIDKKAEVKVKAKGTIDLLKIEPGGRGYSEEYNYITVTPTFKNLNSSFDSYEICDVELNGAYKDLFMISNDYLYSDGCLNIQPRSTGELKAGEKYTLSVTYKVKNGYGEGGGMITLESNTFTVKPKQSVPKVTLSQKKLMLYASAKGEENAETMYLYVPHSDYKIGYYTIQSADGSLDVNKDGIADLIVTTEDIIWDDGGAQINVYISDADAIKATAKGVTYKIPVTVRCEGRDGVSKDAVTTVSVVVKK